MNYRKIYEKLIDITFMFFRKMNPDIITYAAPCDVCKELVVFKTKTELDLFCQDPVCSDECAFQDDAGVYQPKISFFGTCRVCDGVMNFPTFQTLHNFKEYPVCSEACTFLENEELPYSTPEKFPSQPRVDYSKCK